MSLVSISITGPDPDWLADHARSLVEERLAACGNIIPTVRSVYRWEDAVEDELEAYLIVHTRAEHIAAVIERTNAAHPYDTVQILATEIVEADPDYAQWVYDSTER
jgi:periplasmic divalent cation tolerance protein